MKAAPCVLAVLALAGCHRGGADLHNVQQTKAPGHIAAGGHTSGEVFAASPQDKQAGGSGPAGTPGIPQGAEGNTGGANIGGQQGQASQQTQAPPLPVVSEKAGNATPSTDVKTGANVTQPGGVGANAPAKAEQK